MVSRSIWTSWQNAARGEGHGLVQARDMRAYSMASRCSLDAHAASRHRDAPLHGGCQIVMQDKRRSAYREKMGKIPFELAAISVQLDGRTKTQRGSSLCVNHLSFLHFVRSRLLAACSPTQPRPVQALVRPRGRRLARSRTTTLQNPHLSAAPLVSWLATPASAADLAQPPEFMTAASQGSSLAGRLRFVPAPMVRRVHSKGESCV